MRYQLSDTEWSILRGVAGPPKSSWTLRRAARSSLRQHRAHALGAVEHAAFIEVAHNRGSSICSCSIVWSTPQTGNRPAGRGQ